MMSSAADNCVLYRSGSVSQMVRDLPVVERVARWCEEFLARPHPRLGRNGSVCPFIPRALAMNKVVFAVVRTEDRSAADIDQAVSRYRDVFLRMEPVCGPEAMDKAIIVILPEVSDEDAPAMVDETHRRLKPQFVEAGLMIGKFHPLSDQSGLHNPGFRPLRSPVPLLAIRHMVDSDLPFLNRCDDPVAERVRFLEAYGRRFEGAESSRWSEQGRAALAGIIGEPEDEQ
jgi:Domain of unknown function (DUF6875)